LLVSDSGFHELRRRLLKHTIWAADAIPPDEWKYRHLKTVVFPVIDLGLIYSGVYAAIFGAPAIGEFFHYGVNLVFSVLFVAAAGSALIGVSFPRLWVVEVSAKTVLSGLLTAYLGALFILTTDGDSSRGFITGLTVAALGMCVWKASILGSEWATRRAEQRALEEAAKKAREATDIG
jgi:phosphotransferase system  glucose/maltose/N-acetylglucosamine-specific IIC component